MKYGLAFCVFIALEGLRRIATGAAGSYHGVAIAPWVYKWIALLGFLGALWHLYAMWHEKKRPKPKVPLDEQCAQAKADLDRMYLREHGTMPEWPEREEENKEKKENV